MSKAGEQIRESIRDALERERLRAERDASDNLLRAVGAELAQARADLAAARELLKEARNFMPFYTEELRARIDAALAKDS